MDEYLPPIVTKLKADLSDLIAGFAEARLAAKEFARGIDDDLTASLGHTGQMSGMSFTKGLRDSTASEMKKLENDVEDILSENVNDQFKKGGAKAAVGFMEAMKSAMWPVLIGLLAAIAPGLITMLGSIITLGIGLGFTGIAAFVLKDQEMLVTAATHLKDTLKRVFLDAAMPMLEPLSRGLWILANTFEQIAPAFKDIFTAITPGIVPLFNGLAGMLTEMMPALKELAPVIAQVMTAFGESLPLLGKGFADLFRSLASSTPAMVEGMKMFMGILSVTLTFLGWLIEKSGKLFLQWEKLAKIFTPFNTDPFAETSKGAEKAWNWLGKLFSGIGHWFGDVGKSIADWAVGAWKAVWGWVSGTGKVIGNWFVMVGRWFADLPGLIGRGLALLPGIVSRAFWVAFDAVGYALGYVMAKIWKFGYDLPDIIGGAFAAAWKAGTDWTNRMILDILGWWEYLKVQLPIMLAGLLVSVYQWGLNTEAAVAAWGQRTWAAATAWTGQMVLDVIAWLKNLPIAADQMGNDVNSAIVKWFKDAGKWLWQAGSDMMWGFINGMLSVNDALNSAIGRFIDKIKQGVKDGLKLGSPSRLFAEYGQFSVQGFIQGFLGEQMNLNKLWAGMVPPMSPAMALGASGGGPGGLGVTGGGGGQTMVHATFTIDGKTVVEAITPAAQERKMRSGETGLS